MNFLKPNNWVDPNDEELDLLSQLLKKVPQGEFQIVVRDDDGAPLVIENAPFFYDGTPMPTRYWLVESPLFNSVSKLESAGGVKAVQEVISLDAIAKIHSAYEQGRNKLIDPSYVGPRPSAGVGGTRKGVKCLHAHVANFLAGNDDAVGLWALDQIKGQALQSLDNLHKEEI